MMGTATILVSRALRRTRVRAWRGPGTGSVPPCRTGTQGKLGPASAVHHCVSHRARDTELER